MQKVITSILARSASEGSYLPSLALRASIGFFLAFSLAYGQGPTLPYSIEFNKGTDVQQLERNKEGQEGLYIAVKFAITLDGNKVSGKLDDYKLAIEENGREVKRVDVPQPTATGDMSVMLAIDTSGSMQGFDRMNQARGAGEVFLNKLPKLSDCGLILFDHEIRKKLVPIFEREPLLREIRVVQPRGGTAYLDAAAEAVRTLSTMPPGRDKAVVLMTDGIDLNSSQTLEQVIAQAKQNGVRVYTIGIGEPGKLDRVSTALVLDHSGSMKPPADDKDTTPKIDALHEAATRYVKSMSSVGRVSLIPFSTQVENPRPFGTKSRDLVALNNAIKRLTPVGETALFDAIYVAINTLEADGKQGKRAVVAMTDGIDNSSRRRVEEVIQRAKEAKIPLHLLGFGREGELDRETMDKMAKETGGKYYHARNKEALLEIFEKMSMELHDDGIDESTLKELAHKTGGQYYPAKNVSDLRFILENVSKNLQVEKYEVMFKSLNQRRDGTQRDIALKLIRRDIAGTEIAVTEKTANYQTGGLIVAEMNPFVYLGFLMVIGMLISLPAYFRRGSNNGNV